MKGRISELLIALLSAIAVVVNLIALISLVRSFKRLRQRLYVFIINLMVVEVIAGSAFLIDTLLKIAYGSPAAGRDFRWSDMLEGLKNAAFVLSSLNAAVVTYALHRRTTSMGRHRADSSLNSEGSSILQLPAFDTMMRVLSMGQNSSQNSSPRKQAPRREMTSPNRSALFAKDLFERRSNETTPLRPSPYSPAIQVKELKNTKNNSGKGSSSNMKQLKTNPTSTKTPQLPRLKSVLVPRTSWTTGFHQRTTSGVTVQSYVGRHGNAVVSVRTTTALLLLIWIIFFCMWLSPAIARLFTNSSRRRIQNKSFSQNRSFFHDLCPMLCQLCVFVKTDGGVSWFGPLICTYECSHLRQGKQVPVEEQFYPASLENSSHLANGFLNTSSENRTGFGPNRSVENAEYATTIMNANESFASSNILHGKRLPTLPLENSTTVVFLLLQETNSADTSPESSAIEHKLHCCQVCSSFFSPLSKVHVAVSAFFITFSWLFMLASSLHLLRLRKTSSNVFVRCSALWRFILAVSIFYFVTLVPYVALSVFDVLKGYINRSGPSPTSALNTDISFSNVTADEVLWKDSSSALLLVHCAVLPAIYLIRLLGFRRLLSGV